MCVELLEVSPPSPSPAVTAHPLELAEQAAHAVLFLMASEMNDLTESETEGSKEIVIELPPTPPPPFSLKSYYICSRKAVLYTHTCKFTQSNFPYTKAAAQERINTLWHSRVSVL